MALLLGLLIAAAVAPTVGVAAYAILHYAERQRAAEIERVLTAARSLAAAVDRELRGQRETLEVLAGDDALRRGDIALFRRHTEEAVRATSAAFVLVDRSLQQIINTRLPADAPLPITTRAEEIKRVLTERRTGIGDLETGTVTGRPQFAIRHPVLIDGEVRYVLSLVPPDSTMRDVLGDHPRPDQWFASILDRRGRIVARSAAHEEFLGRMATEDFRSRMTADSGVVESVDLEGRASVTAYATCQMSRWKAIVWVPQSTLLEPLTTANKWAASLMMLGVIASVGAAAATGFFINQATQQTVAAAAALGRGTAMPVPQHSFVAEAGEIQVALNTAADAITKREADLKASESRLKLLLGELSHRSMNLLTVVHAIARQTGRTAATVEDYGMKFDARVAGLARSHQLLVAHNWSGAGLAALVSSQVEAVADLVAVEIGGPPVQLSPAAAQNIGMAIHELATNAAKYGAFSVAGGGVAITWEILRKPGEGERFRMTWQEKGGPPALVPKRRGFGLSMIERAVASAVGGETEVNWSAQGLVWTLEAPLDQLTGKVADEGNPAA